MFSFRTICTYLLHRRNVVKTNVGFMLFVYVCRIHTACILLATKYCICNQCSLMWTYDQYFEIHTSQKCI